MHVDTREHPLHSAKPAARRYAAIKHAADPLRLVAVIPALNEKESIARVIEGIRGAAAGLAQSGVALSIYVIDDGSSDGTAALATAAGADRVLRHRINLGLGAAVRTAIHAARQDGFDILVKIDADLQHDPRDISALIEPILRREAEVVYGNRFERIEYKMPLVRRVGNIVFSRLMKYLTGWPLRDSQPGIFAVSKDYLAVSFIPGDYNYTQQILLDAYHKHMRFAHVPVAFRARRTGKSFISFAYPFKVVPQILLAIASVKPMRIFVPVGMTFMTLGIAVFLYQFGAFLMGYTARPVENVNLVLGSVLFGLQTVFFGVLAQLIVQTRH